MYIPKIFQQDSVNKYKDLITQYPLATLITYAESGIEANHIPLILNNVNGKDVLQGHIAKANPLWKNVSDKSKVLVVFNGPNCYISPNYYPSKKENGRAVPTWNYVAVHVQGAISFITDDKWNLAMINNLTNQHEAKQAQPWSISDAPEQYIQKMLPAIVGFEIEILSITGKWKVSQNQPEKNKQGVYVELSQLARESENNVQQMAELVSRYIE